MDAAEELIRFVERYGYRAPEVLFQAALELVAAAVQEERRDGFYRFREIPRSRVRGLRAEVAGALRLARLAVALQEQQNENDRELSHELHQAAAEAARRRRFASTADGRRVGSLKAAARRQGAELTADEVDTGRIAARREGIALPRDRYDELVDELLRARNGDAAAG